MTADIQRLKAKIDKLDEQEYIEIFKLIHKNSCKYTQNANGIFLDINALDETVIVQLQAFLDFVEANRKHIKSIEEKIKANQDNNYHDRVNPYENFGNQESINNEYSPFVTELIEEEEEDLLEKDEVHLSVGEETTIVDDECASDDEDDNYSIADKISKKKKANSTSNRLIRKCKNISSSNYGDQDDDKDIFIDCDVTELTHDQEV